jgi:hypothetical protein
MLREKWNQNLSIESALALVASNYPPNEVEVIDAATWSTLGTNYCARLSGWVTVPATGQYQFHLTTDDAGRLFVSQDEDMANAVLVASLNRWSAITNWNTYATQHSPVMSLKQGQIMAIYAVMQQTAGGDSIAIGWTGPGPGMSRDITIPTLISNWVTATNPNAPLAKLPQPGPDEVDVALDSILSWKPGENALRHDVYLGTVQDDVSNASRTNPLGVLVSTNQDATTYDPVGKLELDMTYYWRIDEVAADNTIIKGTVWRFDSEPMGYPISGSVITATASSSQAGFGPENTINGSGLDAQDGHSTVAADMWQSVAGAVEPVSIQYAFDTLYKLQEMGVWNYNGDLEFLVGFGLKEVAVEHSLDGTAWTVLGNFSFNQGTSAPDYTANTIVDFMGAAARYVRLVVKSSFGSTGLHGLSEVRFLYIPNYARQPVPASSSTGVDTDVVLTWRAGRDAVSHNVYLSTDKQAVVGGTAPVATVAENRYALNTLDLGRTYFWKVNEVESTQSWEGNVWNFTTQDCYVVDAFEDYNDNDIDGMAIWQTWIDGFSSNTSGSQVGHFPAPFSEWVTVRKGQSMPFYYNNTGSFSYSEAVRTFETAQDWTRGGTKTLVLYFQGLAENTAGQLYVKINDVKVVYDGAESDLTKPFWIQWTIDLAKVGTDLKQVRTLTLGVEGGYGTLFIDDIRLYRIAPQQGSEEIWIEAEAADSLVGLMKIYSDRADASGGKYIAAFGKNNNNTPLDDANPGRAQYTVKLAGGTYRIIGRVSAPTANDDSFWITLERATTNTTIHTSGWVRWGLVVGEAWHDVPVRSMDNADTNQTVLFTVEPGIYNLQISYREDGAMLDAWMITKQLP